MISDFLNPSYLAGFLTLVVIYAVFAIGLNVHWGYTGIFNFGVAGFFAVGAYTSAILTKQPASGDYMTYIGGLQLPYFVGLIGAGLACAVLAFIIGIPTLRLREDYLAIASIGVAETLRRVFINEMWLVNGTRGMIGIPQPLHGLVDTADYKYVYLAIAATVLLVVYVAVERGIRSPWGRVLRAIREDEMTAAASGKNIFAFKMQAFMLGAFIMGIGGAMYASYVRAITPDTFVPMFGTFLIWVMLIVGGSGNNKGAILGALAVWLIWNRTGALVSEAQDPRIFYVRNLLIGVLVVAVLLLRPKGIWGEEKRVSVYAGKEPERGKRKEEEDAEPPTTTVSSAEEAGEGGGTT
ncbi:MAG TPA: branched-chain amino acid ABC transporter permease [Dehalococcoidia bacterium]|nr:branched-chain amino acid ABC transporter permease [Dehalococcoidia bacterium]